LRELCKFLDALRDFLVVPVWNITTRGRHIGHEATTFCALALFFS
jgi:hypothetical protein